MGKKRITLIVFAVISLSVFAKEPQQYHAVVKTTRTYMDVSRETQSDYWFTKGKTFTSNGRVATISRHDLGVVYTLLIKKNIYYVDSIKADKKDNTATKDIDFRYIGVDRYNPVYDWVTNLESKNDTTGLFKSDHYIADGDADFDQVSLEFWLTKPDDRNMAELFSEIAVNSMSYQSTRKPMADLLSKKKQEVPVRIIELINNPIAPPIKNVIVIEKLEPAEAPEGIFDLPAGAKKAQ